MAHKKAAGSTRLGRDSRAQRLGVKIFGDQFAKAGNIIVRQHGLTYIPGKNVCQADDDTLHALVDGKVSFKHVMRRKFTGSLIRKTVVEVNPVKA